jgi:hypothetical protein
MENLSGHHRFLSFSKLFLFPEKKELGERVNQPQAPQFSDQALPVAAKAEHVERPKNPEDICLRRIAFSDIGNISSCATGYIYRVNSHGGYAPADKHLKLETLSVALRHECEEWVADAISKPGNRIFRIAEIGNTMIGLIYVDEKPTGELELLFMVENNYRGKGMAKVMVTRFIESCIPEERRQDLVIIVSETNIGGKAIAGSLGIRFVVREPDEVDDDGPRSDWATLAFNPDAAKGTIL